MIQAFPAFQLKKIRTVDVIAANLYVRQLTQADAYALANYFAQMLCETRTYFGPHPLNQDTALTLCEADQLVNDDCKRLVLVDSTQAILGYFILQFCISAEDKHRYESYGLLKNIDYMVAYAPSLDESLIGKGIGSLVFEEIKRYLKHTDTTAMLLMGGVQQQNGVAVSYYKKLGFNIVGEFQKDVENLDMMLNLNM